MATNHYKVIPPTKLDKYFISTKKGGYSEFSERDTRTGYTLPNCTAFAEGWFNKEYNKLTGHKEGITFSFNGNAKDFYNDAKRLGLETGKEPKEGAIMCWSGGLGHVAICNQAFSDHTVEICESNYGGKEDFKRFIVSNSSGRYGMSNAYTFLGFIYNPAIREVQLPDPGLLDIKVDQVYVTKTTLRCRTYPNLKADIIGFARIGYYNSYERVECDGYTWHRIGDFQWIAEVKGSAEFHKAFEVGSMVKIEEGTPVRITYRKFAYDCYWVIEKEYNKRLLLKHFSMNYHINVSKKNIK